ncbi:MAG TPA: FAD-dependent oxidoreductase [Acidimicrobiaceae bacterium]|nr:FAD-dependent oxidoreductase [Acidimicrobiaceae bacterium]
MAQPGASGYGPAKRVVHGLWQSLAVPGPAASARRFDRSPAPDGHGFRRAVALERLGAEAFDVLVVGGGITGAGVALDAASRGLSTALVERHDFASGTSSKSSKMVHGGIRYLQQRDFRLVYESLHERQRLLDNAPHLVTPLPFLIPLFGKAGVVSKQVTRAYSTALWLYDLTGGIRIGKRHRRIDKAETLSHLPTLRTDALVAGFLYYDARADDARLTLTILRTAVLDHGAVAANYAEVTELVHDGTGRVRGARVRPVLPVPGAPVEPEIEVRAEVVVNATGVWADDVRALDEGTHPHSIRPAKGIHVTVPRQKLPADIAAVVPVAGDRRSVFVVPWADGDDVYIGTTDTDWDGPLDDPACLPEDVDYVVDAVNAVVTEPLERGDVTGVWAGLRPLAAAARGQHLSARTADMSRRHLVRVSESGMVTVTGGKLTTYRQMAEDAVNAAVRRLGTAAPAGADRCRTAKMSLRGAAGLAEERAAGARAYAVDDTTFAELLARHGDEAPAVLELAGGRPELLEPLVPGLPALKVEALWAAREEMAVTVDDVLERRTRSLLRRAAASADAAPAVAALVADEWGRDRASLAQEAERFADAARAGLARAGLVDAAASPGPAVPEGRSG